MYVNEIYINVSDFYIYGIEIYINVTDFYKYVTVICNHQCGFCDLFVVSGTKETRSSARRFLTFVRNGRKGESINYQSVIV